MENKEPTEPGFYWYRWSGDNTWVIVHVDQYLHIWTFAWDSDSKLSYMSEHGTWGSRIPQPENI